MSDSTESMAIPSAAADGTAATTAPLSLRAAVREAPARHASRLHRRRRRPRDPHPRHSDGAGDDHGERVRGLRRVLRLQARGERRRDRRSHRIVDRDRVRARHGSGDRDLGDGRASHGRARSRGRGTRRDAGDSPGARAVARARRVRRHFRAAGAARHGRVARRHRAGYWLRPRHARRQRDDRHALSHQRRLPRCGRRGDRDARAVARQRDQHRARTVFDLRPRSVPAARRDRRGGRHEHRPRHRRAVRALESLEAGIARRHPRAPSQDRTGVDRQAAPARVVGGAAVSDRDGQLDRVRANSVELRQRHARRIHDRHSRHHVHAASRRPASPTPRRRWSGRHSARGSPSGPRPR